ncbi:hypothetical protein Q1695_002749 [Nippostrongylus brasiliensis]|nr:hypothetical protein Q1695_002749 [Nippostrongylus brasiliensis]
MPEFEPDKIVTDEAPCFYNGFRAVFPQAKTRLHYCRFHILQTWKRKMNKLVEPSLRTYVHAALRNLLNETQLPTFERRFAEILAYLKTKDQRQMAEYLEKNYLGRTPSWASFANRGAVLDTTMISERFHLRIKEEFLHRNANSRVDGFVELLIRAVEEIANSIDVKERRRFVNCAYRLTETHKRHKAAAEMYKGSTDLIVEADTNSWQIQNRARTKVYEVKWEGPCSCDPQKNTHCLMCGVCAYDWFCTCSDNRAGISCIHRHAIKMHISGQADESTTRATSAETATVHDVDVVTTEAQRRQETLHQLFNTATMTYAAVEACLRSAIRANTDEAVVQLQEVIAHLQLAYGVVSVYRPGALAARPEVSRAGGKPRLSKIPILRCGRAHNKSLCLRSSDPPQQKDASRVNRPFTGNQSGPRRPTTEQRPHRENGRNHQSDVRHNAHQANTHSSKADNADLEIYSQENPNREKIVLMTALGSIWNHNSNQFERVLFFFDTGAQKTIIKEETVRFFGLPSHKTEQVTMSGLGGHTEKFESNCVSIKISDAYGTVFDLQVYAKPAITDAFPSVKLLNVDKAFLRENEIYICNPKLRGEYQIPHILVGLDYYYNLVLYHKSTVLPSGLRMAKTIFGPTIYGRGSLEAETIKPILYGMTAVTDLSENEMLKNLFELEGLGISSEENSQDEKANNYLKQYAKSISFESGYVVAPFPLKENVADLSDNCPVAARRLMALQVQLSTNSELRSWYCKIINDYIASYVIEEVTFDNTSLSKYYMPHSGV